MAFAGTKAIIDEVLKAMGPKILEAVANATGSSSTASTARPGMVAVQGQSGQQNSKTSGRASGTILWIITAGVRAGMGAV